VEWVEFGSSAILSVSGVSYSEKLANWKEFEHFMSGFLVQKGLLVVMDHIACK